MYYIGIFDISPDRMVKFRDESKPTRSKYPYFRKVIGPYSSVMEVDDALRFFSKHGYRYNPARSERQRRFMCAELGRLRAGKKTITKMTEEQLREFCRKQKRKVRRKKRRA